MDAARERRAPVGILDLDLHYPNGTAAIVAPMADAHLHSLHALPVTNVPALTGAAATRRASRSSSSGRRPAASVYLGAVAASIDALAALGAALVLSLGYDTVAGDPHGSLELPAGDLRAIGGLLAGSQLPVCVIQEGGYALDSLAACSYAFASGLLEGQAP